MHRTTIVQNKIVSIICSCLFFCRANIYRPSPGKVWLGKPNPNLSQSLNIYLRRKKNILLRIVCTTAYSVSSFNFQFTFSFIFEKCIIKPVNPLLPMWTNSSSKPNGIGYALLKVELF